MNKALLVASLAAVIASLSLASSGCGTSTRPGSGGDTPPGGGGNPPPDGGDLPSRPPPVQGRPDHRLLYDPNGNLHTEIDALGRTTTQEFDALNRLRRLTRPPPASSEPAPVIQLDLDGRDEVTRVIDPRSLATSYEVNGLGDITLENSPDRGTMARTFTDGGQVATVLDARGHTTTFTYDDLNRLSSADYGDGSATLYTYDEGPNGIGRLTGMRDPGGVTTGWVYDAHGRVISMAQALSTVRHEVRYGYDSTTCQRTSLTYPSGRVLTYGYGVESRQLDSLALDGAPVVSAVEYHPFGGPKSFTLGNGQVWRSSLDENGRLKDYTLGGARFRVAWDEANRITEISHETDSSWDRTYGYDDLDRLTSFVSLQRTQSFAYDLGGNLTAKSDRVGDEPPVVYECSISPSSNRMTGVSSHGIDYTYDAAGNRVGDGHLAFDYPARGRLSRSTLTDGSSVHVVQYLYNGLNLRVRKQGSIVPQGTQIFVYDEQARLLGEYDGLGRARAEHIWLADRPVAVVTYTYDGESLTPATRTTSYVEADHLAAPRRVSSGGGKTRWTWHSAPYGDTEPDENPEGLGVFTYNLRFPGQYHDAETGLAYNHHRDYESFTGRYVQSDPVGVLLHRSMAAQSLPQTSAFGSSAAAVWAESPVFNAPYLYAAADPVSGTDEEGLFAAAIGGRVVGGAVRGGLWGSRGGWWGAGIGAAAGALSTICQPSERDLCERDCDADYDRGRDYCRAMSGMRGRDPSFFQYCMRQVEERYIECYQECGERYPD